jgi:hypothetical protein
VLYSSQNSTKHVVSRPANNAIEPHPYMVVILPLNLCSDSSVHSTRIDPEGQYHEQKAFDKPPLIDYYGLGKLRQGPGGRS